MLERLKSSREPVIQYKLQVDVLGEDPDSERMQKLQKKIRSSQLARQLLSEKRTDGRIPYHPYGKWYGPHWVLTDLADLYYPEDDRSLNALREQEYEWLFSQTHLETAPHSRLSRSGHLFSRDSPRIHTSMEANAIFSLLRLGLHDDRTDELVDRLLKTQWLDGGWAEAGSIKDERCKDALDLLESKRLNDGGFPAEARYYHNQKHNRTGMSLVHWGGVSSTRMNEFVTLDALYVLMPPEESRITGLR